MSNTLQSLDLILEDVSAEINLSINGLEQFSKAPDNFTPLKKSIAHLEKLKGVFTLLQMVGARRLTSDAIALIKGITKKKSVNQKGLLEILSTNLARLMRYVEHVNQKTYDIPQLLLPAINSLRASINATQLNESAFFNIESGKPRNDSSPVFLTSEESGEKSRYFRQMFQIGFIEVLRQTNVNGGLKMMQRAMLNLDNECKRPTAPNLWWLGQVLFDGFTLGELQLTKSRLKLLGRLDLQIRQVENNPTHVLANNRAETRLLGKEILYLISISGADCESVNNLLSHFEITPSAINDTMLIQENAAMRGPSEKDYHSISETLSEEINSLLEALKTSQANPAQAIDQKQAINQMTSLNGLLKILQLDEQTLRLSVAIDLLETSLSKNEPLTEKDSNILLIVLESIARMVEETGLSKFSDQSALRRTTLSKAKLNVCEKSHKQLKQAMNRFQEFSNHQENKALLTLLTQDIKEVANGFKLLKSNNSVSILQQLQVFIKIQLGSDSSPLSSNKINWFADIISSLEFYLETLKFTADPSEKILEFAEASLQKLTLEE